MFLHFTLMNTMRFLLCYELYASHTRIILDWGT